MEAKLLHIPWLVSVLYSSVPLFWFAIHPFADFWRRMRRSPYWLLLPIWAAIISALAWATWPWHSERFYSSPWMWAPAVLLMVFGLRTYTGIRSGFGTRKLSGEAELRPQEHAQELVTTGLHARMRHPIYVAHLLNLAGWSLGSGLVVSFALLAISALGTFPLMVWIEEQELEKRFGQRFLEYKARVPLLPIPFQDVGVKSRATLSKLNAANRCSSMLALAVACLTFFPTPQALADAGVFTGNGQNLHQITSEEVRLVSIDVNIVLERGPFLFDGGIPGMDRAEYFCTFVLQNLSSKTVGIQVGFPVDSQFAGGDAVLTGKDAGKWVLNYGFIARDERATYNVDFVRRKKRSPQEFAALFVWRMKFLPKENKILTVQYRIPISVGLVSLAKDEKDREPIPGLHTPEFVDTGMLEMAGYITSTGSSWSGNVKTATFTVITGPFEAYLERRGVTEESEEKLHGLAGKEEAGSATAFPVRHPWWFREIKPAGWRNVRGGVQWRYENFKPKDPIDVRYYITQYPRLPEEVDAFVDALLSAGATLTELEEMNEVVLSTYGKEPEGNGAREFASAQLWYAPRKDFSMADLTPGQKATLAKLNARIERLKLDSRSSH